MNNLNNNNNIDIVRELVYMSTNQLYNFKNFYRDLSSEVIFMEYRQYLPHQFFLVTDDYECFLFYRDDDKDEIRVYYDLQRDTIDYNYLVHLYKKYNDMGILITNSDYNYIGIEDVKNIEVGGDLDYNLIDCIEWLLEDIELEDIELIGCNDYTKNLYKNYLNNLGV